MTKDIKRINNKVGLLILLLIALLAGGIASVIFVNTQMSLDKKREEISSNLETIYNSSVDFKKSIGENQRKEDLMYHDKIARNLGIEVYNQNVSNKYSALIQNGDLIIYYGAGENIVQYPTKEMLKSSKKPVNKEDYENYEFYTYSISSGKVVVTGFSEEGLKFIQGGETIMIPGEADGKVVSEISDMAFYNKNISGKVVIPESIKKIGRDSFSMNGERGRSNSIKESGSWIVKIDKWVKTE